MKRWKGWRFVGAYVVFAISIAKRWVSRISPNKDRSIKAKYSSDAEHPVFQPENNAEYIARLLTIWVSSLSFVFPGDRQQALGGVALTLLDAVVAGT